MNSKMTVVLIALLVIGTIGGTVSFWDTQESGAHSDGITSIVFDGDPPPDPDGGIPSGDPEHPQGGGGGG